LVRPLWIEHIWQGSYSLLLKLTTDGFTAVGFPLQSKCWHSNNYVKDDYFMFRMLTSLPSYHHFN